MSPTSIDFPNLGIHLENVPKGFYIGDFSIAIYGIMIATGMFLGFALAARLAKDYDVHPDMVWDFAVPAILFSVCGARAYYVIMSWDNYKDDPISVLYLRQGGLAIYGGVIAAFITMYVYTRIRRISYFRFADIMMPGLLLGQIIGRWGNFFNREAFGGYNEGLLAMRLPVAAVRANDISEALAAHITEGVDYIQVHPTFLYEGLWNLALMLFLIIYGKKKSFDGEIFLMYIAGYGIGRFWIESLRTDQLIIPGTAIPVSMAVSSVSAVIAVVSIICVRKKLSKK